MPKKKQKRNPQEISVDYALLSTILQQCEEADGFDGVEGSIYLTIEKGKITRACMSYIPEPAEEATVECFLGD